MKRLILAVLASAMLSPALALAAPAAALASAAPPPTATFTPVGATAVPNPYCTLSITRPRLLRRTAEVSATIRCRRTVTNEVLVVGLYRNGHLVARAVGRQARGRGFTVTAARACRNNQRGSFTGLAEGQVHTSSSVGKSGPVMLACGF